MCVCVCVCVCVSVLLLSLPGVQISSLCVRITLSPVATLARPYFLTLSDKWHDFRRIVIEYKMCVLIYSTLLSEKKKNIFRPKKNSAKH